MSYILDALAQSQNAEAQSGLRALSRRTLWQMIAIGVLLLLVVALGAAYMDQLRKPRPKFPDATTAKAAPRAAASDVPSMAPRPAKRASAPAAAAAPVAGTMVRATPAPVAPAARFNPPIALSQPLPNPSPRGPGGAYVAVGAPPAALGAGAATDALVAAAQAQQAQAQAQAKTLALSDLKPLSTLPPELRSAVAQMKVRVLFYAPQRRARFVLLDSREVREGEDILDGLRLEEITETGLVLRHKGTLVLAPALAGR